MAPVVGRTGHARRPHGEACRILAGDERSDGRNWLSRRNVSALKDRPPGPITGAVSTPTPNHLPSPGEPRAAGATARPARGRARRASGRRPPAAAGGDRPRDLGLARLRHRRHQPPPPGVGRLRGRDRPRQRRGPPRAARHDAAAGRAGRRCSTRASSAAAPTSSPTASSSGTTGASSPTCRRRPAPCPPRTDARGLASRGRAARPDARPPPAAPRRRVASTSRSAATGRPTPSSRS